MATRLTTPSGGPRPESGEGPHCRCPARCRGTSDGEAAWIGYLLTHWAPLAWVALFILLPVAGLGMATLVQAIPEPDHAPSHRSVPAAVQTRNSAPVVMIAAHGVLATATHLLALLGSVAVLGSR